MYVCVFMYICMKSCLNSSKWLLIPPITSPLRSTDPHPGFRHGQEGPAGIQGAPSLGCHGPLPRSDGKSEGALWDPSAQPAMGQATRDPSHTARQEGPASLPSLVWANQGSRLWPSATKAWRLRAEELVGGRPGGLAPSSALRTMWSLGRSFLRGQR